MQPFAGSKEEHCRGFLGHVLLCRLVCEAALVLRVERAELTEPSGCARAGLRLSAVSGDGAVAAHSATLCVPDGSHLRGRLCV